MSTPILQENFLYYIWKTKCFDISDIVIDDKKVKIEKFGHQNMDSGPDFSDASVRIDNILWSGSVEMHINSSDWVKHRHHKDAAYNKVILHVVYNHDRKVYNQKNNLVPTLELRSRIDSNMLAVYNNMMENISFIPCELLISSVPQLKVSLALEAMSMERLIDKSNRVLKLYDKNQGDWENTLLNTLFRYFGGKVNGQPFEHLYNTLPINIFNKIYYNDLAIEALLFGQSGLLPQNDNPYISSLYKEHIFLKAKYNLRPINKESWKFSRMRPSNFPTIRIAQLAALLNKERKLFYKILELNNDEILSLLVLQPHSYWNNHYTFAKKSNSVRTKRLGKSFKNSLIINVIAPTIFAYGLSINNQTYKEKAIELLESSSKEDISIVNKWSAIATFKPDNALHSQAILHQYYNYCLKHRCTECRIGNHILKNT